MERSVLLGWPHQLLIVVDVVRAASIALSHTHAAHLTVVRGLAWMEAWLRRGVMHGEEKAKVERSGHYGQIDDRQVQVHVTDEAMEWMHWCWVQLGH